MSYSVTKDRPIALALRTAAALVAALALLASCSSEPESRASTTSTSKESATSNLEGTWRTKPVSLENTEATLRTQGFARYVDDYRANAPFSNDTVLELSIENGQWNLYGKAAGGPSEPIDYDATYKIDGDTITFDHSDGSTTHRWSIDGDTLKLEFVKGTMPPYEGIPDEVFQRALYMTETFNRIE